jgi:two-component system, NarL family, nitrate/nitrite response regulator NarL
VGGRDRLQSRRVDIAVVDDHPIILDSIASWGVAAEGDIRVVVTAATVDALLAGPGRHADVVLLDLDLDDGTTVERNVAAILAAGPAVLVLSASDKPLAARAAIRAGARGYAMKNEQTSQIRVAIREVAAGRDWISPRLACIFAADDAADSPSLGVHDGTVRAWRLADGTPVGEPLTGHSDSVNAMAVGALPDGTPVIVSGGADGTVRVWRLADGTPVVPPLDLPGSVRGVAVHGNVIVASAGADISAHQPALARPMR